MHIFIIHVTMHSIYISMFFRSRQRDDRTSVYWHIPRYATKLVLKDEPIDNNSFNFLETTITYTNKTNFKIKNRDKNFHSLCHHNKLTKIKSIDASSFGPKQQPTNTFYRMNSNCSNNVLKMHPTLQHIHVYICSSPLRIQKQTLQTPLTRMSITTEDPL